MHDGRPAEALSLAERGLALQRPELTPPRTLADLRFLMGRARWEQGATRAPARALVEQALEDHSAHSTAGRSMRAQLDAWLASHPAP